MQPRLLAFPIAALSILLTIAGSLSTLYSGREIRRMVAWKECKAAIAAGDTRALATSLDTLTRPTVPTFWRLNIGLQPEWTPPLRVDLASQIVSLLQRNALGEISIRVAPAIEDGTITTWAKPAAINDFIRQLRLAEDIQFKINFLRWEKSVQRQQLQALVKQQLLLKGDLADLLGVREATKFSEIKAGEEFPEQIDFYQAGMLEGLPALEVISDNIPGILELIEEASRYGGTLKTSSLEEVQQKISKLQESSRATVVAYNDKLRSLEAQRAAIEGLQKQLKHHLAGLKSTFNTILLEAFLPPAPELLPKVLTKEIFSTT